MPLTKPFWKGCAPCPASALLLSVQICLEKDLEGDDDFTIKEHPPLKPGEGIPDALARWADPGYFSALQIPLLQRTFLHKR